jgi:hypothetical protein
MTIFYQIQAKKSTAAKDFTKSYQKIEQERSALIDKKLKLSYNIYCKIKASSRG